MPRRRSKISRRSSRFSNVLIFGLSVHWNKTEIYFRWREDIYLLSGGGKIYIYYQVVGQNLQTLEVAEEKTFQREEKLQVMAQMIGQHLSVE